PRVASPYDHEQPTAGHLYAIPNSPPLLLPDDWDQRVREAGAAAFRSTDDRPATLAAVQEVLQTVGPEPGEAAAGLPLFGLPWEKVRPFLGIGFGFLHINALFEAMEHENLLAVNELWQDVQEALNALADPDAEAFRRHLQAAAGRLEAARQVLYP